MRTVLANTGEVREARRFAIQINAFLKVVLVTVWTQTVVIFAQLGLSRLRDVLVLASGMHQAVIVVRWKLEATTHLHLVARVC